MNRDTFNTHFSATGTAGGPGGGGCPQPSCANCEELAARVAVLEEERKILARERDEARGENAKLREAMEKIGSLARVESTNNVILCIAIEGIRGISTGVLEAAK